MYGMMRLQALRRLLSHASHLPEEMLSCLRDLPPVPDVDVRTLSQSLIQAQ